jgi:hypothetical protein
LSEKQLRQTRPAAPADADQDLVHSGIKDLARSPTGELVATLDNGQVWRQIDSTPSLGFRPGDQATVKRGAVGSFLLIVEGQPRLRVRRLK